MLISIVAILLAFVWLLIETDLMTVRLPIGEVDKVERKSWEDLKRLADSIPDKQAPMWLKHPECMTPLCGLDWLENTMHVIPQYKFELAAYGVKHRITLYAPTDKIINSIAQIAFKPTPAERKELRALNKRSKNV